MFVHSTKLGQTILIRLVFDFGFQLCQLFWNETRVFLFARLLGYLRLEDLNRSVTSLALLNMRFMQVWMTSVVSRQG